MTENTQKSLPPMPDDLRAWFLDLARRKQSSPLPVLKLRLVPGRRCGGCGGTGYVDEKSALCAFCLAPRLALFHRRRYKQP